MGQISSGEAADQKELTAHKTHCEWAESLRMPDLALESHVCNVVWTKSLARSRVQFSRTPFWKIRLVSQFYHCSSLFIVLPAIIADPPGKFHKYSLGLFCYLLDFCWFKLFCPHLTTCAGGDLILYEVDCLSHGWYCTNCSKRSFIHVSAVMSRLATWALPTINVNGISLETAWCKYSVLWTVSPPSMC